MEALTKRLNQLDRSIVLMAGSNQTIWANQKELTKSQNLLDEQFAVSTRMAVMGINLLLEKTDSKERIEGSDIEVLFRDWAVFRARPDFREHMMEWMLGVPLSELPPPPKPPEKEEGESDAKGDIGNENAEQKEPSDGSPGQEDDVPEVPQENCASG